MSSMTEAEAERAAVVAYLEREAAEWKANGLIHEAFGILQAARAVKRGDHLK